jgi:hypothetical protein
MPSSMAEMGISPGLAVTLKGELPTNASLGRSEIDYHLLELQTGAHASPMVGSHRQMLKMAVEFWPFLMIPVVARCYI